MLEGIMTCLQTLATCRTLPQLDEAIRTQGLDPNDKAVQYRRAQLEVRYDFAS